MQVGNNSMLKCNNNMYLIRLKICNLIFFVCVLLSAKLNIATEVIAENLGIKWRKLGRKLQVSDVRLDSISKRHSTDLEETAVELLKEWRRSRGAEARTEELIRALRDCLFNLTADKVEDKLKAEGYQ